MKKYKTLTSLSLGGDVYFFDKTIFDKFIKKEFKKNELITREKISKILSSKDYLRFNRTSLLYQKQDTFFTYANSDVQIIVNSSAKKINELFISTTNLEIEKEIIKEHTEEDLLDLENKQLIILERDKKPS